MLLKLTWDILQDRSHTGHKTNFSKCKKIETIPSIFSDCNSMKLDPSNRRKTRQFTNVWKLNNTLLKNQWLKE